MSGPPYPYGIPPGNAHPYTTFELMHMFLQGQNATVLDDAVVAGPLSTFAGLLYSFGGSNASTLPSFLDSSDEIDLGTVFIPTNDASTSITWWARHIDLC